MDKNWSLVPKNVQLVSKNGNFVLFTLKMKFLSNKFTKMYKFWIKNVVLYQKCTFAPKKQNNCTFYTKNEVFAKKIYQNVQILDKYWSFVPENVHLVLKNQKICTFYSKMKFLPKNFTKMYKFWIKTVVLYQKCTFAPKKTKQLYFLH